MSEQGSKGRARVARSRAQWGELVSKFEASGMSRSAFCREHALARSSFDKAMRRSRGVDGAGAIERSPFVAVSIPEAAAESKPVWDVELQLSAQTIIRLRMG